MKTLLPFILILIFSGSSIALTDAPFTVKEIDRNQDGKTETWNYYQDKALRRIARDSNYDGKPDIFKEFVRGNQIHLREVDSNHDGKVDKRSLVQWDPSRRLPISSGTRIQYITVPTYVSLVRAEDRDFDGKIDYYKKRGLSPEANNARIGRSMDQKPWSGIKNLE